jgi:hypothetical protein
MEFEKQIKQEAEKILQNLDFEAEKIIIEKDGASVKLRDKQSGIFCWFDLWQDKNDIEGDWNKYIFYLDNSKDLLQKYIQESCDAFDLAFSVSVDKLESVGGFKL